MTTSETTQTAMTPKEIVKKFKMLDKNCVLRISDKNLWINRDGIDRAVMVWSSTAYKIMGSVDINNGDLYLLVRENLAKIILLNRASKSEFTRLILNIKGLIEKSESEEDQVIIFKKCFDSWRK